MRKLLIILALSACAFSQARIGPNPNRPERVGSSLPTTCNLGDIFFLTTISGANAVGLYECTVLNTWTAGGPIVLVDTPLTTRGDLITADSTPKLVRLAAGGASTVLHGGTDLNYGAVNLASEVTGQLPISAVGSAGLSGTSPAGISAAGAISISGVTGEQGNGSKLQLSTGTVNSNRIAKFDANGNTINGSITDTGSAVSTGSTLEADGVSSIGGAPNTVVGLWVQSPTLTGTTEYGILVQAVCSTSATVACNAIQAQAKVAAGAVTVAQANTFHVTDAANGGGGATITKLVGLEIDTLTQGLTTNLAIETGANDVSFGANVQLAGVIKNVAATATMGITLKNGSGGGNYTASNTTYANVDTTNLCTVVTIPSGWKLGISVGGSITSSTAIATVSVSVSDIGTTCGAGGTTALKEVQVNPTVAGTAGSESWNLNWVISGDGAAHAVSLQAKTSAGADAWLILNSSSSLSPSMVLTLMPSN